MAPILRGVALAEIRPGVTLRFWPNEPLIDFAENGLDRAIADDILIGSAIAYPDAPAELVRIATADLGLELKLLARGWSPLVMPEELRLRADPDPVEMELQQKKRELEQLKTRQPKLVLRFGDSEHPQHMRINLLSRGNHQPDLSLAEVMLKHPLFSLPSEVTADKVGS